MAVTSTFTRTHASFDSSTFNEFVSVGLTGTYVPGGFTWNPFTIFAGKGSSPLPSSNFLSAQFFSTLGYQYVSAISGNTVTTKIYSAAGTELSAGALPEAAVTAIITKRKL
jgi:hypothetical protein